eukprot:EG_transcript_3955
MSALALPHCDAPRPSRALAVAALAAPEGPPAAPRQRPPSMAALHALRQQHLQHLVTHGVVVRNWASSTSRRGEGADPEPDQPRCTHEIVKLPELKTWDCPIVTPQLTVLKTRTDSPVKNLVHNPYSLSGPLQVAPGSPLSGSPPTGSPRSEGSSDTPDLATLVAPTCQLPTSPGSQPHTPGFAPSAVEDAPTPPGFCADPNAPLPLRANVAIPLSPHSTAAVPSGRAATMGSILNQYREAARSGAKPAPGQVPSPSGQ